MSQGQQVHFLPANDAQRRASRAYERCEVLFLLGPAGTGKSHAALGLALADVLAQGKRKKILLARPLVACDEEMGFLKGDLAEKLGPWHGALNDVLPSLTFTKPEVLLQQGTIELSPLGLMRGRTVGRAVGILDEAQNCTLPQLRMFLTRIGEHGKLIVCGDPQQSDVPGNAFSRVVRALHGVPGVGTILFPEEACVRHPLIPELNRRLKGI